MSSRENPSDPRRGFIGASFTGPDGRKRRGFLLGAQIARATIDAQDRTQQMAAQRAAVGRLMDMPLPAGGRAYVAAHDVATRERAGWSRLVIVTKAGVQQVARHDALPSLTAQGWALVRQVVTEADAVIVAQQPEPPA
ncbi:MAG: hypothetical protein K8J09_19575 [Planctomycetes bacterium]|nr:hypothetical protein [Planctomycetota bacterium]